MYAGKIETLYIDKKKGIVRHTLLNIFLTKIEHVKQIDNILSIDMVKKGAKRLSGDFTHYIMRFVFSEGKGKFVMEFGNTFSYYEIQKKYRICKALLKGEVIKEQAKMHLLVDESVDETQELL